MPRKHHALAVLVLTAAVPLAACGDDEEKGSSGDEPTKVAMELKPAGKKPSVSAPESIDAGVVTVDFTNSTKKDAGLQFVRIVGDHTPAEVIKVGNSWGDKGTPLPRWIELEGGVPNAPPGTSETTTQALKPGRYLALRLDGNEYAEFEVSGNASGRVDTPAATIDATEYAFEASGLKAGKSRVRFANKGGQPHFVVGIPLKPGKTIEQAKAFFASEGKGGSPPFAENDEAGFDTPIQDGGGSQLVTLDLRRATTYSPASSPTARAAPHTWPRAWSPGPW
ncbi:MAG TPA: hypothetical protein VEX39_04890 [Thermoleophilaceae bacterium]|nr:hypothetical protein [Thermoleophilaceae bacterium]